MHFVAAVLYLFTVMQAEQAMGQQNMGQWVEWVTFTQNYIS